MFSRLPDTRKSVGNERGVSAAEFALVLPILIILVFGIIEFGIILYDKAIITNASREGARQAILWVDEDLGKAPNPTQVVLDYAQKHLITFGSKGLTAADISVKNDAATCGSLGKCRQVTVRYEYEFMVLPKFVTELTGPLILQAVTIMRDEDQG